MKRRREALAITRDGLAEILCLPTEALRRQEEGDLFITPGQLKELTHLLGVDVSYFFEEGLAKLEHREPNYDTKMQPADDSHFLLSLLRVLDRMTDAEGVRTNGYLRQAADEVERALRSKRR